VYGGNFRGVSDCERDDMKQKLTPWFPSKVKPVRVGVYVASIFRDESMYRYWNGRTWSYPDETPKGAFAIRSTVSECSSEVEWRGLAEQPK
jgi:hypothetical protein